MPRSHLLRIIALLLGIALLAASCSSSDPTSAERPDDDNLGPEVTPGPTSTPEPTPIPTTTDYTIVAGDTLAGIATSFGVTVEELLEENGMTAETVLNIGEVIRVPIPPPSVEGEESDEVLEGERRLTPYTVVAGDTPSTVAGRFDVSLQELLELNEFDTGVVLNVGDVLQVPVPDGSAPETAPEGPVPAPGTNRIDIDEYVVIAGDSPSGIASRFGITVNELFEANGLTEASVLQVGQVLTIPEI